MVGFGKGGSGRRKKEEEEGGRDGFIMSKQVIKTRQEKLSHHCLFQSYPRHLVTKRNFMKILKF